MKTKIHLMLVALFFALVSSCKKNDSTNDGGQTASKKKYLTQIIAVNGSTTTTIKYTYDAQNRLAGISSPDYTDTYTYTTEGLKLINESYSNGASSTLEFLYQDGKVTTCNLTNYSSSGIQTTVIYTFVYAGDKVAEIHYGGHVALYTYDSNNNITAIAFDKDYTNTYSYDNKPNMFTNAAPKFAFIIAGLNDRFSPNNVVQYTGAGTGPGITTIRYNYDSDGYPNSAAKTNSTASYLNTNYSYTYTEM
jgi:YD repeat-containing protein